MNAIHTLTQTASSYFDRYYKKMIVIFSILIINFSLRIFGYFIVERDRGNKCFYWVFTLAFIMIGIFYWIAKKNNGTIEKMFFGYSLLAFILLLILEVSTWLLAYSYVHPYIFGSIIFFWAFYIVVGFLYCLGGRL